MSLDPCGRVIAAVKTAGIGPFDISTFDLRQFIGTINLNRNKTILFYQK